LKRMERGKLNWCDAPGFARHLAGILAAHRKTTLPVGGLTVAAVLVPIYLREGTPHVLLTKRSEFVEHHRGEISFPGGKRDPGDPNLLHCALRETSEEVGIAPEDVHVIGELDDFYTVATRFLVVPFVGMIPYPYRFQASEREIAGLLQVPLDLFFDPSARSEDIWDFQGRPITVVSYRWESHTIWGATARIMKHFVELVTEAGTDCRRDGPAGPDDGSLGRNG
jgi:8-oxo-dGTP pyrophosphatase MutT (NUDIX family)